MTAHLLDVLAGFGDIRIMTGDDQTPPPPAAVRITAAKCARCAAPVNSRTRPFCSQRCWEIDLGSWLTERYTVNSEERPAGAAEDENP